MKLYYVRWYRNGFNYRDTSDVPYRVLQKFKKLARQLGEEIEYEEM